MEKTVQNKRKKFLIVIPIVIAGLMIGSIALLNANKPIETTAIEDSKTPLAGPAAVTAEESFAGTTGTPIPMNAPLAAQTSAGEGVMNIVVEDNSEEIRQMEANLVDAQEKLDAAQGELAAAEEALKEAREEADKTEAELTAAEEALKAAQAKVDEYKDLKKIYETAMAITAVASESDWGKKIAGFAGNALNSTGYNHAPAFAEAVKQYAAQNNLNINLDENYYRVWCRNGVVNVFIADAANSDFWVRNGDMDAIKKPQSDPHKYESIDIYKFFGTGQGSIAAGTMQSGDVNTGLLHDGDKYIATIDSSTFDKDATDPVSYEEIRKAEQALKEAEEKKVAAEAADKQAQQNLTDAEADATEKAEAVEAAQTAVDDAQAELDAANQQ